MSFVSLSATPAGSMDPILLPLLQASGREEFAQQMERILVRHVDPIISAAVRRYVNGKPVYVQWEAAEVRAETVCRLLQRLGNGSETRKPIRDFEAYVKITARHVCWNRRTAALKQMPASEINNGENGDGTDFLECVGVAHATETKAEQTQTLRATWREIELLPPAQRVALLLHFRVPDGRSGLGAFLDAGSVSRPVAAGCLCISQSELNDLLPCLPMDDALIGKRMGRTAKDVNNLRKSARTRLIRRLREWL